MLPSPQPPKGHFLPQWSSLQAGLQQLKYSAAFLRLWDSARRLQVLLKKEMQDPLLPCLTYYGHGDLQAALDLTFCYKKKIKNQTNKEGHKPIWFPFAVILMSSKLGSVPPSYLFLPNLTSTLGKSWEKGGGQRLEENAESPGKWEINTDAFVLTENIQWNATAESTAREPREHSK